MSVLSITPKENNPVSFEHLEKACAFLGVSIKDEEREDYRKLLATFHETAAELTDMPDYEPQADVDRFTREDVHFPQTQQNKHGAWAWKCSIKDKKSAQPGLLSGKTVVLKDNISVAKVPMLMGTDFVKGYIPSIDAPVVTRILEAGGHVVGKATCENMCHSATSHSAATGPVHNPFAESYSSGGSSSGCGVLVANREVDLAIGADQGGSVRIPACNCGLVGFKPTFGLVPYTGCGSNEPTNDHLGPMTRTVLDNALLLEAIAGTDNIDDRGFAAPLPSRIPKYAANLQNLSNSKDLAGLRIGIITESLTSAVMDPRIKSTFLQAASLFNTVSNATVTEISIPLHKKGPAIWAGVSKVGGYLTKIHGSPGRRSHQMLSLNEAIHPMQQQQWDAAYVATKNIYLNGAYAATTFPHLLSKATNLSRQLRDAYDAAFEEHKLDVLITPTLPRLASSHCAPGAGPLEQIEKQVGLTGNTCQFNQTGHPALTLPVGMLEIEEGPLKGSGRKLPVGLQIVGRWWAEETVLRVAYAWEQANEWREM